MSANSSESDNPWLNRAEVSGDQYDSTYEKRAASGQNVHGEADFVESLGPRSVLDAGCGTGRVGRELARRGIEVVGVDIDKRMLGTAQSKAPDTEWRLGDLANVDLGRQFDVIVMAGNVILFVTPGTEGQIINNMARHLETGGQLVAGFQLGPGNITLKHYDLLAQEAGLILTARFSTWDRQPWDESCNYAVSMHSKN